jgi:hypothetical protein
MVTHQIIEKKLVDFYLKKTGHYGNSVMQSIDVTKETLEEALDGIEQPISTFEKVIRHQDIKLFSKFLSGEIKKWHTISRFRYIVFLCYIASQDDPNSENFRSKLQKKLGLSSSPRLDGVNILFQELVEFSKKNENLRRVEIPSIIQPHMKLIGIIYEFSFPNWRLNSLLNKNLYEKEHTPETLSKELLKNISELKLHVGLYQAIRVFNQRVALKNIFLDEDPFWNFYKKWKKPKRYSKEKIYFYLENDLESSYFDLPNSKLKINELNGSNSKYFVLKRENKSFNNGIFFFKESYGKYELKENIQRFEDIDAVLYQIEKYDSKLLDKNNALISQEYCFLELNYKNLDKVKEILLANKVDQILPPLQILSSFKRKELLSLNIAPIKFRANFDGKIEFIHIDFHTKEEKVNKGDEIYLPYLNEGELKIILTTGGQYPLSKVEKFKVVRKLKGMSIKSDKKEFMDYIFPQFPILKFSDNIVFDYKKSSNYGNDFFEELLELIYYNSIDGILESSLLKLIIGCEALYKFNPYDVITILKHYGYLIWGYRNGYKSIKYWPKSISLKKISHGNFLIQGYISEHSQKLLCDQLEFLNIDFVIKKIQSGRSALPLKILITNNSLENIVPEYFLNEEVLNQDGCTQISYLSKGESYYKSFDIFKYDLKLNKFLYLKEYLGHDGVYLLKQKDRKKCNLYEIIYKGDYILSTYCRDQIFDCAYKYGIFELDKSQNEGYTSYPTNFSCYLVSEFFSKNGILPYLDLENGHYYYPKGLVESLKFIQDMQEHHKMVRYNLHRHRRNIRFRA